MNKPIILSANNHLMRLQNLRENLKENNLFPYLTSNLTNIFYLTGFVGTYAHLIVDDGKTFFITDSRYQEYARSILPNNIDFILQKKNLAKALLIAQKKMGNKIFFVDQNIPLSLYLLIKEELNNLDIKPGGDQINRIRAIKDEEELINIRKAVQIADNCFTKILEIIKPGICEWDISVEIEYYFHKNGCKRSAFDTVVASGKGSSMPHYETSMTKKIDNGDILLIDMGCEYNGYNSDMTRTVFLGNVKPEFKKIYRIVKDAQEKAISSAKQGITTGKLDRIARSQISKEGFGSAFGHSLGHGVGLEVHEIPTVRTADKYKLKKNVVITIEPGIYIPNSGGVRIEDMIIIKENDCELLTKSSKGIIIL
ncbi:MAG: Xaa-Pro peptidase family protein [Spirochaetota bacterium]|nr:Xaa-Pro peptidase family protein [Spirochaetota bacterium]